LALAGVRRITVVNRSEDRGADLAKLLRERLQIEASHTVWSGDHAVPSDTDIVINATSIGLYAPEARLPLDCSTLRPGMIVADVVFNPVRTRLLADATALGCRPLDGLGMLVNQGVLGVQYWTGVSPDAAVMRAALEAAMGL
jgi:shikimate dehydrogenase